MQRQPRAFFWQCNPDGALHGRSTVPIRQSRSPSGQTLLRHTVRSRTSSNNRLSKTKSQNLCLTTSTGTDYRFACQPQLGWNLDQLTEQPGGNGV